ARRLIGVEHDQRADTMRLLDDSIDVLNVSALEENMRNRYEQRLLVNRVDHTLGVNRDPVVARDLDDAGAGCPGMGFVNIHHRRKVHRLVYDLVAFLRKIEARDDDRLADRDVLMHRHRPRIGADDPRYLVAGGDGHLPPTFLPGANPARRPHVRVIAQPVVDALRHRAERVVDQVKSLFENRKLGAVRKKFVHNNLEWQGETILFSRLHRKAETTHNRILSQTDRASSTKTSRTHTKRAFGLFMRKSAQDSTIRVESGMNDIQMTR